VAGKIQRSLLKYLGKEEDSQRRTKKPNISVRTACDHFI
jgi:hypothetical protein